MTDQPKWTKGPWPIKPTGDFKRIVIGDGLVDGPGGYEVAEVYSDDCDRDEAMANAHLIAAAPDMATVLEYYADQFCEGFCKDLPQAGTYQPEMDLDCSGCKARSALAKARGQA